MPILIGYSFPEERVLSAQFPPPTPNDLSNIAGAHLLWQAARLTLREGATPLRSLGRISIRPRTYQFVPLLMALRDSGESEAITRHSRDVDAIADDSPELIRRKKELFEASHRDPAWLRQKQACDLRTAAFFQRLEDTKTRRTG